MYIYKCDKQALEVILSFNPHNNPKVEELLLYLFYRRENWGSEKLNNLGKFESHTFPSGGVRIWSPAVRWQGVVHLITSAKLSHQRKQCVHSFSFFYWYGVRKASDVLTM